MSEAENRQNKNFHKKKNGGYYNKQNSNGGNYKARRNDKNRHDTKSEKQTYDKNEKFQEKQDKSIQRQSGYMPPKNERNDESITKQRPRPVPSKSKFQGDLRRKASETLEDIRKECLSLESDISREMSMIAALSIDDVL